MFRKRGLKTWAVLIFGLIFVLGLGFFSGNFFISFFDLDYGPNVVVTQEFIEPYTESALGGSGDNCCVEGLSWNPDLGQCEGTCGNGVIDPGEFCDPGTPGVSCNAGFDCIAPG